LPSRRRSEATSRVSSDNYGFLPGVGRQSSQGFFAPVLKNQGNGLAQVRQAFFTRFALAVGAGHLSAIRHEPRTVLLDNRRKFVAHFHILPCLDAQFAPRSNMTR